MCILSGSRRAALSTTARRAQHPACRAHAGRWDNMCRGMHIGGFTAGGQGYTGQFFHGASTRCASGRAAHARRSSRRTRTFRSFAAGPHDTRRAALLLPSTSRAWTVGRRWSWSRVAPTPGSACWATRAARAGLSGWSRARRSAAWSTRWRARRRGRRGQPARGHAAGTGSGGGGGAATGWATGGGLNDATREARWPRPCSSRCSSSAAVSVALTRTNRRRRPRAVLLCRCAARRRPRHRRDGARRRLLQAGAAWGAAPSASGTSGLAPAVVPSPLVGGSSCRRSRSAGRSRVGRATQGASWKRAGRGQSGPERPRGSRPRLTGL